MKEQNTKLFSTEEIRRNKFIIVYDDTNKNHALHLANACCDVAVATCWSEKTYLANEEQMTNQNIVIFLSEKLIAENICSPTLKEEENSHNCIFVKDGKKYGISPRPINDEELETYWKKIEKIVKDNANSITEKFQDVFGLIKDKNMTNAIASYASLGTFATWISPTVATGVGLVSGGLVGGAVTSAGGIPATLIFNSHDKSVKRSVLRTKFLWDGVGHFIDKKLGNLLTPLQ